MEAIFHEQQEGSLCAQHCLNSLLQGQFYSAVDLAELAQELDGLERAQMAELGDSEDYRRFLEQPSVNMDDSGFFSVQVLERALSVWGLELIPYSSSDPLAARVRQSPLAGNAFICNYREHWFTIRRIGRQWFNLNSLLEYPELVSNSYLKEFLAQLQQEGYSIFIVKGNLPESNADLVLQANEVEQAQRPRLLADIKEGDRSQEPRRLQHQPPTASFGGAQRDEEADIEAALLLSMAENVPGPSGGGPSNIDDEELQMAIAMSRSAEAEQMPVQPMQLSEEDELQQAISLSLSGGQPAAAAGQPAPRSQPAQASGSQWGDRLQQQEREEEKRYKEDLERQQKEEEEELRKALEMSLQQDQEMRPEPPVVNVGGVLKHKKLTSPQGTRMDTTDNKTTVSTRSGAAGETPTASAGSKTGAAAKVNPTMASSSVAKASPSTRDQPQPGPSSSKVNPVTSPSKTAGTPKASSSKGEPTNVLPTAAPAPTAMPATGGHTLGGGGASGSGGPAVRTGRGSADSADPAEIRRRRLAFLEKMQKEKKDG